MAGETSVYTVRCTVRYVVSDPGPFMVSLTHYRSSQLHTCVTSYLHVDVLRIRLRLPKVRSTVRDIARTVLTGRRTIAPYQTDFQQSAGLVLTSSGGYYPLCCKVYSAPTWSVSSISRYDIGQSAARAGWVGHGAERNSTCHHPICLA